MTAQDLLDPKAGDRFLRAYALLASEYANGAKSAIDALLPFVQRAAADFADQQFDAKELSQHVERMFRVRIPIYMMDAFKHKLLEAGALYRPSASPELVLCSKVEPPPSGALVGISEVELAQFEVALARYAEEMDCKAPFASQSWSEALIRFFAGWEERKAAIVKGQLILDSKRVDDRVVSGFIAGLDKSGSNYGVAKKLYLGVLVADFFTCMVEVSGGAKLDRVGVLLDTTLLMRLLGTSGLMLQEATQELVVDIQALHGTVYYFSHTYEETVESLEALSVRMANRGEINRETAQAFHAGEVSATQVQMLVREADKRLGALGITQYQHTFDASDDEYQIGEDEFARAIGGSAFERHRIRWQRDAMSLGLIMRIRKGARVRQFRDAGIVFVTHNGALVRSSRDFTGVSAFEVPPMLTTDQVSVLAWLERGGTVSDAELSAKLASACYEAVIPREGWEVEFWAQLESLKQSDEYRGLLGSQLITDAMRSTVLDRSFGEPSLAKKLSLGPVLKELAAKVEAERESHGRSSFNEGRKVAIAEIDLKLDQKSAALSATIARVLLVISMAALLLLYLMPALASFFDPAGRDVSAVINVVFSIVLSVVTLLSLFGIAPTFIPLRRWLADALRPFVRRILEGLVAGE